LVVGGKLKIRHSNMRYKIIAIFFIFILNCCKTNNPKTNANQNLQDSINNEFDLKTIFSESEKFLYMDSISKINPREMIFKIAHDVDSVFNSSILINKTLSDREFIEIEKSKETGKISLKTARKVFNFTQDSIWIEKDSVFLKYYDLDNYMDYAICFGEPSVTWENDFFFLKKNRLLIKRHIYHHGNLNFKFFQDVDNNTVVYWTECFGTGTGVWQYNYFFLKYFNQKIIPILNIIQNGNLRVGVSYRNFWIESKIVSTNPLKMKFEFNMDLPNESLNDRVEILNDSSTIDFCWNENKTKLLGNFNEKLKMSDIYCYYINTTENYNILQNINLLKKFLNGTDSLKRKAVLYYLDNIMKETRNEK
jgi:hypothetical protein